LFVITGVAAGAGQAATEMYR